MTTNRIALTCAVLLCAASTASATPTRVESLGGGDALEDVADVLRWYGSLPSYGGTALFELGGSGERDDARDRRAAAAIIDLDGSGAWGTGGVFVFGDDPRGTLRLAWGRHFGSLSLGCHWHLDRRDWNDNQWTFLDTVRIETDDQTIGLGGRLELGPRAYLDAALDHTQAHRTIRSGEQGVFDGGRENGSYSWRLRLFRGLGDRTVLVPSVAFRRDLHAEYIRAFRDLWDRDLRLITVGLGLNHLPDADTMLVGSFTFRHAEDDLSNPRHNRGLDVQIGSGDLYALRLGLEHRSVHWLTLRAGVRQSFWSGKVRNWSTSVGAWSAETNDDTALGLSLGLAVHVGPVDLDLVVQDHVPVVDEDDLLRGLDFDDATWGQLTLQYVF